MQYPIEKPEIVERALSLAGELGFPIQPEGNQPDGSGASSCCIDSVGSLLRTICLSLDGAKIGEIGTGAGVGTAWLASGADTKKRAFIWTAGEDVHFDAGLACLDCHGMAGGSERTIEELWTAYAQRPVYMPFSGLTSFLAQSIPMRDIDRRWR